jgi:hypothetical protein
VSGRSRLTRAQRPRISEKAEQQAIVDLLRLIGAKVYILGTKRRKGDYQGTMQTPGIPDLYAFLHNQPLWIEVKARGGNRSEAQFEFANAATGACHAYFCGTADEFTAYLRDLGFRVG